jgi:hypothetical protein
MLVLHCEISTVRSNGWTGSLTSGGVVLKWSVFVRLSRFIFLSSGRKWVKFIVVESFYRELTSGLT